MKRFLFSLLFLGSLSAAAQGAELDTALRDLCNRALTNIYQDILAVQGQHPELKDFGENNFYKKEDGIYAIFFEGSAVGQPEGSQPYAFGLTIESLTKQTFKSQVGTFSFGFPALGIKFSGFQSPIPKRGQFDLRPLIHRHGIPVSLEEQKRLPVRLEVQPAKDHFALQEPIVFDVILTNKGSTSIFVKKLDVYTLYFIINNKPWGTPPSHQASGGERVSLKSGESLKTRFTGESYGEPGEVEMNVMYRLLVNGVNPFASVKIKIRD